MSPYHRGDDVEEGHQREAPQQEHYAVTVEGSHIQQHHGQQQQLNGQLAGTAPDQGTGTQREEIQQLQDHQTTQVEEETEENDWDPSAEHGDRMLAKQDQQVRVLSIQLNTYPKSSNEDDKAKLRMLRALIVNSQADVAIT